MRQHYVIYDRATGEVLQAGSAPEIDVPEATDKLGVLITETMVHAPRGKRVVNSEVVDTAHA